MSTAVDDYHRRLNEIKVRDRELYEEETLQHEAWCAAESGSPEREAAKVRRKELEAEREALRKERDMLYRERDAELEFSTDGFHRPTGHLVTLLNKGLGALPKRTLVIEPTQEALATTKSYRLPAFVTVAAAIAILLTLTVLFPWMAVSPYILTRDLLFATTGSVLLAGIAPQIIFTIILLKGGTKVTRAPSEGKFLDKAAMLEEQWFRTGAEAWTVPQRIYSCVAFGAVHVLNFIYPLASLLVVGMMGGVAMSVYLREYKRSGDTRLATLASTKFHATYNRFAVAYMVVALCVVAGIPFIS